MRRILVVILVAGLVVTPAAVAKGPHAVLTSGPEAVMPGVPWEATVELNEFRDTPRPLLIAVRQPRGHVDAKVRRVAASIEGGLAFKTTMVFPTAGRWKLMLIAGRHRFNLPTLSVGTGKPPQDWVAFPVGSADATDSGDDQRGGSTSWWLFPLAGVVLAGVGAAAVSRRGSR